MFSATELDDKKRMRELVNVWLQANPDHPFHTSTLAEYVAYELGEAWQEYCARMRCEGEWGGAPELVAIAQVWQRCIRVFENSGDELFHLQAVFGAGVEQTFVDIVHNKVDHYDTLVGACLLNPIAHGAEQLRALGKLETHELSKAVETKANEGNIERKAPEQPAEPENERKTPEQTAEPKAECKTPEIEHKAPEQLVEPGIEHKALENLTARKELKQLEDRKARERHAMRKKPIERKTSEPVAEPPPKTERKTPEPPTEPEIERKSPEQPAEFKAERKTPEQPVEPKTERKVPEQPTTKPKAPKDLDARKTPKYQHESRKARAAREVREELQRYRMHRAREDLAASKVREHEELRQREDSCVSSFAVDVHFQRSKASFTR